ncbi:hypothetical protein [Burkholderia ubonensis]|uniref:hypothetical protein n=1 Tax=Burkholderia ubonensis TaxID=101571 RepID=UPI003F75181A
MALAAVRSGRGGVDQISCLLGVVYLAFFMREATRIGTDVEPFRQAEAVLDQYVSCAERGEVWALKDDEHQAIERVLVLHDEQLEAIPNYRYVEAWERLQRYMVGGFRSPITKAPCSEADMS